MIAGGLLLGFAGDYGTAVAGRLLSGVGAVLFSLVLTKMATDWFAGREIVLAMAVVLASWPFGIAAGLVSQGLIARAEGWRAAMHLATAICALALLLLAILYRSPPPEDSSKAETGGCRSALPCRHGASWHPSSSPVSAGAVSISGSCSSSASCRRCWPSRE